jgi:hypothetical protein
MLGVISHSFEGWVFRKRLVSNPRDLVWNEGVARQLRSLESTVANLDRLRVSAAARACVVQGVAVVKRVGGTSIQPVADKEESTTTRLVFGIRLRYPKWASCVRVRHLSSENQPSLFTADSGFHEPSPAAAPAASNLESTRPKTGKHAHKQTSKHAGKQTGKQITRR